jgi:hypothetical protein
MGVALVIVVLGRHPVLADFATVFHWELGFALATAVLVLPIDTRPRAA